MPPELWVDPMAVAQSTFVHKACDIWRCSFRKAIIPYSDWRTHKTEIMPYTEHKSFHWCGGKVYKDMDRELRFWTWAQSTQQHKDLEWTMGMNFLGNRAYIFRCCIFLNLNSVSLEGREPDSGIDLTVLNKSQHSPSQQHWFSFLCALLPGLASL